MKFIAAASAAAIALSGATAFADDHGGDKDMSVEDKFAKMDTDSNGIVTEAEFLTSFEEKVAMKQEEGKWTDWTDEDITEKSTDYFNKMGGEDGALTLEEAKEYYAMKEEKKDDKAMKDGDWGDKKEKEDRDW
ncbi:hypothetical protein [Aquisalinus flavus]|uniref:EF-hand domain-containing protein n=1 Tax=Aquisalinus flavus TaxID=1526572 RepID=A0A8J2V1G6_9PROT|nr:hypothetical protein [Aquisalinus flavus]MBD0427122.1 hypothetical protein [Aquisalinus flavus]UNE46943.1 hypothetical protein FF099_02165 [Aquisalinus flavus]GGC98558.1 hypothetical protein GCM10011342_04360 [Aquisalinus flavus]